MFRKRLSERIADYNINEQSQFLDYTEEQSKELQSPKAIEHTDSTAENSELNELFQFMAFENPLLSPEIEDRTEFDFENQFNLNSAKQSAQRRVMKNRLKTSLGFEQEENNTKLLAYSFDTSDEAPTT